MGAMPRPLQDDELATTMDIYGLASPRAGVFVGVGTEGSLWRSEDGGRSWRVGRLRTRATLSAVAFRGLDGYIVGEAGILFATRDGGISWRRVRLGTDWDLDAVCLAGDAVQYVAGEGGRLFKTIDEGRTWAALPAPAVKRLTAMAFRDQRLGYAVGTGGVILETLDGGATWRRLGFDKSPTFSAIQFTSDQVGYICGDDGTVAKTTTGGGPHTGPLPRWTPLDLGLSDQLRALSFLDDDHGFVIGNGLPYAPDRPGIVIETRDGGASWVRVVVGVPVPLLAICFSTPRIGCIAGGSGTVVHTSDGGVTWKPGVLIGAEG